MLLAEKGGIPRETALEVWLNSVLASPALKYRAPFILNKPASAWFNVNMMQKDLLLAQELGREYNVPLTSVAIANETLTTARAMGLAEEDFAIIFETLARVAGVIQD
jgi:3-hydroxyisobutyrate dehydrogenase-like beta-hydroxyacid dehydrogenase